MTIHFKRPHPFQRPSSNARRSRCGDDPYQMLGISSGLYIRYSQCPSDVLPARTRLCRILGRQLLQLLAISRRVQCVYKYLLVLPETKKQQEKLKLITGQEVRGKPNPTYNSFGCTTHPIRKLPVHYSIPLSFHFQNLLLVWGMAGGTNTGDTN